MTVLGLDIATRTGWAVVQDRTSVNSKWGAFTSEGGVDHPRVLQNFGDWLSDLLTTHSPQVVFCEGAVSRSKGFPGKQIKMLGVAQYICVLRGVATTLVPPTTVKKFATGTGRASKESMVNAARMAGFDLRSTQIDEADAIHVARYGLNQLEQKVKINGV